MPQLLQSSYHIVFGPNRSGNGSDGRVRRSRRSTLTTLGTTYYQKCQSVRTLSDRERLFAIHTHTHHYSRAQYSRIFSLFKDQRVFSETGIPFRRERAQSAGFPTAEECLTAMPLYVHGFGASKPHSEVIISTQECAPIGETLLLFLSIAVPYCSTQL